MGHRMCILFIVVPFLGSCTSMRARQNAPDASASRREVRLDVGPGASETKWQDARGRRASDLYEGAELAAREAAASTRDDPALPSVPASEGAAPPTRSALEREVHRVVDDWHAAAAAAESERYLGHFASDAVFLGTDKGERWDLFGFTAYVKGHFADGTGWTFVPVERFVGIDADASTAWFDEQISSAGQGTLRGNGVLRRVGATWRIVHYSLAYQLSNVAAKGLVPR